MIGNKVSRAKQSNNAQVVYVSNLRFQVNEQQLMDFFKQNKFNPVRARLLYDEQGNSKGYGFVEMSSENDANDCVDKLNNMMFDGRKISVSIKN
jgi:nucleolin